MEPQGMTKYAIWTVGLWPWRDFRSSTLPKTSRSQSPTYGTIPRSTTTTPQKLVFKKRCNTHRSVAERAAFKRASKKPCCVTKHAAVNGALAHKTNTYRCHSMQQTPRMSADPRQNI